MFFLRPIINGKVEEKTVGEGPSLSTMFEDDRHLQKIIQRIRVCCMRVSWHCLMVHNRFVKEIR